MTTQTLPDADAISGGAAKAILDGMVDAGVVPDDSAEYVRWVRYGAPVKGERDAVVVTVEEVA